MICEYTKSLLIGEKPKLSLEDIIKKVKETTGAKFFQNIPCYPPVDFDICFKLDVLDKILKLENGETVKYDV